MMKDIKIVPAGQVDGNEDEDLKVIIGSKGNEETFLASPFLPGILMLDLLSTQAEIADKGDNESGAALVAVAQRTFKSIFDKEEYSRFMDYLYDPKNRISLDDILDIFSQVIDQYSEERPTNG